MDVVFKNKSLNFCRFCSECGGYIIYDLELGEEVCSKCGLVIHDRLIDYSHCDKRTYNYQEKLERDQNGPPISPLTPTVGLHTVFSKKEITNPNLKRAAKWNSRMSWEERNFLISTTELKRISSNLDLPDYVKESAMKLYNRIYKMNMLKGRSINAMVAACIYYVCRELEINRTLHEILDETSCTAKTVRGCYSTIIKKLHLNTAIINPISLIPKYIAKLGLNSDIEKASINILKSYMKLNISCGKDPSGLCAGAIYLVCKLKKVRVSQQEIARKIGVSEVTIRSRYKEFSKNLKIIVQT
jgi:transcription initiation factor TFIIB